MQTDFVYSSKKSNWQSALNEVFDAYEVLDFEWGETDCFCFASDCIKATTGYGPMDMYKGLYDSEESAWDILREGRVIDGVHHRYNGLHGFWSSFLGEPKNIGGAAVGDIALVKVPYHENEIVGVVNDTGRYIYTQSKNQYLVEFPLSRATVIWGIER